MIRSKPLRLLQRVVENLLTPTLPEIVAHLQGSFPAWQTCNKNFPKGLWWCGQRRTNKKVSRCQGGEILRVAAERVKRPRVQTSLGLPAVCGHLLKGQLGFPHYPFEILLEGLDCGLPECANVRISWRDKGPRNFVLRQCCSDLVAEV